MKNSFIILKKLFILSSFLFSIWGCQPVVKELPPLREYYYRNAEVALKWAEMTLRINYKEDFNTPTYSSRGLGYMGLTMYESAVRGFPEYQSLEGQLNGLSNLPKPEAEKSYHWILSMNAAQAAMLRNLYPKTAAAKKAAIDSLENSLFASYSADEDPEMVKRSVEYGRSIAQAIFEWSKTDGGHEGNTRNFDPSYFYPYGQGKWSPPLVGQSSIRMPLHPYWGNNRTFTKANSELPLPKPLEFSNQPNSEYYKQFKEVYDKNLTLTQEEKEIALWWGDDPSETYSPPGHSYNLTNIAVRTARPNLIKAAESYARVGMAVADAFICCWKTKYTYHAERPASYIRSYINGMWSPFWPEPPFPAYSSGHATQGAAAATVLTAIYGEKFDIVDDTHNNRPFDHERQAGYKTRKFNSFWATAEESAMSRLYGGIHTRQDNETGLQEGKKIGQNVNNLKWKK